MGKGGGGQNTVVQQSSPPQQFLNAYQNVQNLAQNAAAQPFQQYPGNLVAPLSPDQMAGIQATEAAYGLPANYINSAAQYISNATQPVLTPNVTGYINQAASPAVVNAANTGAAGVTNAANTGSAGVLNAAQNGQFGVTGATSAGMQPIYAASNSFNPNSIQQFVNPFTQSVVGATEQQFNQQNAQQLAQLKGNAASQGAYGGDRSAVAEALLSGQQQMAEAPVLAGLESQGYQTGVQAAETAAAQQLQGAQAAGQLRLAGATTAGQMGLQGAQAAGQLGLTGATTAGQMGMQGTAQQAALEQQAASTLLGANEAQGWLNSQAGYGMANLGNQAFSTSLQGANALLGVGGLEQQEAQQELNVPYEQFLAQQAYPFQTIGWLGNIAEGMGSAAGGNSSTSYPGASLGSQIAGGALTGASLLGETGAFGSGGWLSGMLGSGAGAAVGAGAGLSAAELGSIASSALAEEGIPAAAAAVGALGVKRGGMVPHRAGGGMLPVSVSVMPGAFAGAPEIPQLSVPGAGGMSPVSVSNTVGGIPQLSVSPVSNFSSTGQSVSDYLNSMKASAPALHASSAPGSAAASATPSAGMQPIDLATSNLTNDQRMQLLSDQGIKDQEAAQATKPSIMVDWQGQKYSMPNLGYMPPDMGSFGGGGHARGGMIRRDDGGNIDIGGIPTVEGPQPPSSPPTGMQPARGDPWQQLMYVGLGMMGGRSPNALTNIGEGALQGLRLYQQQRANEAEIGAREAQTEEAKARVGQINWNTEHSRAIVKALQDAQAAEGVAPISAPGASVSDTSDTSQPRGLRNNNPLNLQYVAGQAGLDPNNPSDGRFGRYMSVQDGIAAATNQILRYGDDGVNTVRGIISKWSPSSENGEKNTGSYIKNVASSMVVDPDQPLNLKDPNVMTRLVAAMARQENGKSIDPNVIQGGVQIGLNASSKGQQFAGPGAPPQSVPQQQQAAPAAPPLFNVPSILQQGQRLMQAGSQSGSPELIGIGQKLVDMAMRYGDKGVYLGTDGAIHTLPGYAQSQADIASAKSEASAKAEFPYKFAENLAYRAATPTVVKPNEAVVTGMEALPPEYRNWLDQRLGVSSDAGMQPPTSANAPAVQQQQTTSGFTPSHPPMPGIPNPTTDPGPMPPATGEMGNIDVMRSPSGALVASQPPGAAHLQQRISDYIGQSPHEIQTHRETEARLISMQEEIQQNAEAPAFLQSGWQGKSRTNIANATNTLASILHLPSVFSQEAVANNQAFNKNSSTAAFALARSMAGGRVALGEVLQANQGTPNNENSIYGNLVVNNLLIQENLRQTEQRRYVYQQAVNGVDPVKAMDHFDQTNPSWKYVSTALASAILQRAKGSDDGAKTAAANIQILRKYPNKSMLTAFDKLWGQGVGEAILQGVDQ